MILECWCETTNRIQEKSLLLPGSFGQPLVIVVVDGSGKSQYSLMKWSETYSLRRQILC